MQQFGQPVINSDSINLGVLDACRLVKEALSSTDTATLEHSGGNGSTTSFHLSIGRTGTLGACEAEARGGRPSGP